MYEGHTVGVVIPAYNEEGFVGTTIDLIPEYVDRIYVVDDGSTDGTWSEILEHASTDGGDPPADGVTFEDRIVPIRHDANRGVGGAIKTGYLRARDDGVDVTAVIGGDDQMDPTELPRYLDPIVAGDADYTKGCRFLRPEDWRDMPRFRFVGNLLLSYLTKVASGYWTTLDPQNGYTAISHDALEQVPIEDMYEYYGYCNDLLVKLNVENLRVVDVARSSTYAYDDDWKSHITYREYIPRVSFMLLRNFVWRLNRKYLLRDFHPLAAFYYLGMGVVTVGIVRFATGDRRRRPRRLPTVLYGMVLFLFAAVLDKEDNRNLEGQYVAPREDGDARDDGDGGTSRLGRDAITADGGGQS